MIIKQSKNGKFPLVLLHGWGLNSGVWDFVLSDLEQRFDVHCIDFPGFGVNNGIKLDDYNIDTIAQVIAPLCPQGSIVAGWSLGGLVASRMALSYAEKVSSLCLIASTPCFVEQPDWKGIKPQVLRQFSQDLQLDTHKTIERFMAIQAMGSESARQDVKQLKQAVFDYPPANQLALSHGLAILAGCNLRDELKSLTLPVKGIYGRLDSLVAIKSIESMANQMHNFEYRVVAKASHAPFISHRAEFLQHFDELYNQID